MKPLNDEERVSLDSGCDSLIRLVESFRNYWLKQRTKSPEDWPFLLRTQEEWDEQFRAYVGWDE